MAHWAFEQGHHIPPFLAFFNQAKYRVQGFKETINDFRCMLDTHIDTIASQVSLGKHFLGNESFVSQCILVLIQWMIRLILAICAITSSRFGSSGV